MTIKVVLVEHLSDDNKKYTSSGLLFSEKFVLITGHLLLPFLKQFNLNEWFHNQSPGIIHYNSLEQSVRPKLNVCTRDEHLIIKPAEVLAGFICQNILKSCKDHLKHWAVEFENKTSHAKELLSLFFILQVESNSFGDSKAELNEALANLLINSENAVPNIGQEVFIESVPFGNQTFLNSYSQGIVSNVVGENSCLLLTDCSSAPGSEGSPVFLKTQGQERCTVAIVISCVNWWNGEWIGLTLAANLSPLLVQFNEILRQNKGIQKTIPLIDSKLMGMINNCIVQVIVKSFRGTAILISKQQGIFLTNSHVAVSDEVVLLWQNYQIKASVIYKTPSADVYDLAVLQCNPSHLSKLSITEAKISSTPPEVGEDVFSAGYPLFPYSFAPRATITKGSISLVRKGMLTTTCYALPGNSGGAIFRRNGELVGITVSNVKVRETGVAYPHVNMAIPSIAIYYVLQDFLTTGDHQKLHGLHCKDSNIIRTWNYLPSKL